MTPSFRYGLCLIVMLTLAFGVVSAKAAPLENPGHSMAVFEAPKLFSLFSNAKEDAALEADSGQSGSFVEGLFSGSFLGALLFGYPYSGMGVIDIAALAAMAFLVFRSVIGRIKKTGTERDRFTVHTRKDNPTDIPDEFSGMSKGDDADARQKNRRDWNAPTPGGKQDADAQSNSPAAPQGNPHDNAWSRRMGTTPNNSPNSPWTKGKGNGQSGEPSGQRPAVTQKDRAAAMWAYLSSEKSEESHPPAGEFVAEGAHVPDGFDVADFLDGARVLYTSLQEAWGKRELAGLEKFLTADMMALLQKRADKDPEPVDVDVLLVEATLKNVDDSAGEDALVLFNALIRTDGASAPAEVREEWRFHRGKDSDGMWRLAGIRGA